MNFHKVMIKNYFHALIIIKMQLINIRWSRRDTKFQPHSRWTNRRVIKIYLFVEMKKLENLLVCKSQWALKIQGVVKNNFDLLEKFLIFSKNLLLKNTIIIAETQPLSAFFLFIFEMWVRRKENFQFFSSSSIKFRQREKKIFRSGNFFLC